MNLAEYDFLNPQDVSRYVDRRLDALRHYSVAPKQGLDDDDIRCVQNLIGAGTVGASFADAKLSFKKNTSYCEPVIKDLQSDIEKVYFSPDNPWYRAQINVLCEYVRRWDGRFTIQPLSLFDPFDLANQLRGNAIFMDVYDHKQDLHRLLDRCEQCILAMHQDMLQYLSGYSIPGSVHGVWFPGQAYLSCDIADMVSGDIFAEFGAPRLGRLASAMGGVLLHHHELGIRQIPAIAAIDGICIQELNRDPNTRHLPEVMNDAIHELSLKKPITFPCVYEDVVHHIDQLKCGKYAIGVKCDTYEQAKHVLDLIEPYRA